MRNEPATANAWIVCPCGAKHKLISGTRATVYQCGKQVQLLKEGDKVVYEEISSEK